jgi:hypothetical protein
MSKSAARTHKGPSTPGKTVRDSTTGRMVEVRGYGALKGQLNIAKGVDLTKPIYDQVKKNPLAPRQSTREPLGVGALLDTHALYSESQPTFCA